MKGPACRARWDEQVGFFGSEAVPNRIIFHQFEPHLLSSDDKGNIAVYEWEKNLRINHFANGTPPNVPITTLRFVNEDDIALLLTGSCSSSFLRSLTLCNQLIAWFPSTADGDIRLFRNYESPDDVKLISSFQGISETIPTSSNEADAGLVVEWQQGSGHVLMGGNVKYIRVWDATRETILQVSLVDSALSSSIS
jgi:regulator-associated protein of mTOR